MCSAVHFYVRKQLLLSAHLSYRNSVCPSVRHTGGSVKSGASYDHQIFTVGCLTAWKTLVLRTVKLFHKFEGVTPNEGTK